MRTRVFLFVSFFALCSCSGESEITAVSKKAQPLPEPLSAGAKLMKQYCTNCHAAPQPYVHSAKEWPNVIYRMNNKRVMRALGAIDNNHQQEIIAYLSRHAK